MTVRSRMVLMWVLLAVLGFSRASGQSAGSVLGFVHDGGGTALANVSLTLSGPGVSLHSKTDKMGAFRFDHVAYGSYRVSADQPGDLVAPGGPIVVSAAVLVVRVDLTLTKGGGVAAKPGGLQLQAAGIRGYIDQGGYSAPAGAAAASNLIQGAADLNRANSSAEDATAACSREQTLLKASGEHPDDAAAQRQLGRFYLAQHQPEKAVGSLQRARVLDGRDAQTLLLLAEAFIQNKQFAVARDLLNADASVPKTAAGYRLLARSDEGLGAFKEASMEYQAAAALEPTEADFYGAGYELILAGSAEAAVRAFEAGTARYPESVTLLMGVGTAEFLLGKSAEATRTFLRCATLHPNDLRLYPFLSGSFAVSGTDAEAVEASFRRYYELAPKSAEAAYFYALVLLRRGAAGAQTGSVDPKSGIDPESLLRRAVQLAPDFAKAHLQLGSVFFDRKDYADAIEEFSATLRLDPALWETHYKLSAAYQRTGQAAMADQQMQLFVAKKSQKAADDQTGGVHIEQFLSVFAKPSAKASESIPCAAQK